MKLKYTFVTNKIGGEIVAVPVGKNASGFHGMLRLNEVAADIIRELDKDTTVDKIVKSLASQYNVSVDVLQRDVVTFLKSLKKAGLLAD